MKKLSLLRTTTFLGTLFPLLHFLSFHSYSDSVDPAPHIPLDQLGAVAGKQVNGDGLTVTATPEGARLRCLFQNLEGEVTSEGLWLRSISPDPEAHPFRVVAVAVGGTEIPPEFSTTLACTGAVNITHSVVQFLRPGLIEEYSVSMDGVRQDFIVEQRPHGAGALRVDLEVSGASAEGRAEGARLVLHGSGRKLAYNRLRVMDAEGKALTSRIEVTDPTRLTVVVNDTSAAYPVRIDPTFTDSDWDSMGGVLGADRQVYAAVADGAGNVYIGGAFNLVGDVRANHIAKWNGSEWSPLAGGLDYEVWAIAVSGTNVYVAGDFSRTEESAGAPSIPVNRIAKWDGTSWSPLGSGLGVEPGPDVWDYVTALAVVGNDLYAGGLFTIAGDVEVANIAKWNGSSWSGLGVGTDDEVNALAVMGTDLYVGGNFVEAGAIEANYIARWNGTEWSTLGSGMDDIVNALIVVGSDLYAGGDFNSADGQNASYIAQWDGSSWSSVGGGVDGEVDALAAAGNDLYAGGRFNSAGNDDLSVDYVAKWNGNTWSALGEGVDDYVQALAVVGSTVFVGGDFAYTGDRRVDHIAVWNGIDWSAMGSGGLSGVVYALAVLNTTVFAGGDFSTAHVSPANNIAVWDGNSWQALGAGMNAPVRALVATDTVLYAGGEFTSAGGTDAYHIAQWNGTEWSSLGAGMDFFGNVTALAVSGSDLYAGGSFTRAGEVDAKYVARWNGSDWSPMGAGTFSSVNALAVLGDSVYAGGYLTLAKWDGSTWANVGAPGQTAEFPVGNTVYALAVMDSNLYVGGNFTMAGDTPVNAIAKWDGASWSALGNGVDIFVGAFAVSGTNLFAGGYFSTAGDVQVGNIAKWDGVAWSALGSGVDAAVFALGVVGTDLYVGGSFISAGNRVSAYAAKAMIGGDDVAAGSFANAEYSPATGFTFTFLNATPGQTYTIQSASSPSSNAWNDLTTIEFSGPIVITDPTEIDTMRFYRAVFTPVSR